MYSIIVMGASWGGLRALGVILSGLPPDLPAPLVIVQHRSPDTSEQLAALLQQNCALPVAEPDDKEPLLAGHVYLAPADYHLLIEGDHFALSAESPVNYSRPSIDVLFESAADAYGAGAIGVILTGANEDGAKGLARIKQRGGFTLAQDPATAENPVMPQAAIATGAVDRVMPLEELAACLAEKTGQPRASRVR